MKINNIGSTNGVNPYKRQLDKNESIAKASAKKDKVEISTVAKDLQQTSELTKARHEKISAIKEQIENGTYKIDASAIAEGLLKFYKK
ncbi:flagellar biosynthesis anti-sigma factor FlgM [Metabacillus fastidiosus]|uniref:Negative regulator of flagellin synthesis n=1 Tax=Metabacillus fastidiosus TaxID=1458 RepID=A0ABU6P1D5_9BACI|nr:flagellar biosynthesis anti-sigma factor FlgM [Metabacillus fastidiosus]MED4402753.1 flagellar biosynthesis anti-sigma factor FlgM [Metabacillus fastidiosus]MED4461180.1 flagellar biosynthesis anti-sigma factor FlgM [Metabacillus fastidiosus]